MKKTILSMLTGIGIALLIMQFVQPTIVIGESMYPYLKDGDFIFIDKTDKTPERGEIVVFINDDRPLIKRVIGLPGEKIDYKNNNIYINGREFKEEYIDCETENIEATSLEDDEYYLLGDNRPNSKDSRIIGPIKEKDIRGIAKIRLFRKIGKI